MRWVTFLGKKRKKHAKNAFCASSLKDTWKIICENTLTHQKKPHEKTFVKSRIGCTKKAKQEIKFEYEIELIDGLKDLIKWRKLAKKQNKF